MEEERSIEEMIGVFDIEERSNFVEYSESALAIEAKEEEDDGSGGRVRPKFFCALGSIKNRSRAPISIMLKEQQDQLVKFRKYADASKWDQIHSGHYDWFMFPIEDGSQRKYNVYSEDVIELRNHRKWILGYREAVELCARAWGWNVKCKCDIIPLDKGMGWTDWDVRLAKIIRSLWLFGEKQYMESMQLYARRVKPNGGLSYGPICLDEVFSMKL